MMLAPLDTANKVATIDTSVLSVGALSANALAGFQTPVMRVVSNGGSEWIEGAAGYPWADTAFVTEASGRDQEVSFKMEQTYQGCSVYLRYDGTTAVNFTVSKGGNTFKANFASVVGRVGQLKDIGSDTYIDLALGLPAGGVSLSDLVGSTFSTSDVWTFGASGDTFYAKFNGVQFFSRRFWTQARPGKIAVLYENNDGRGYRDVTCTFKPNAASYSDFDNLVLDLRDWGFKDSRTKGNMTAGSYTLNVADATNFAVGDPIYVEIGGEAGAGEPMTIGVGGTWPVNTFATPAALPEPVAWRATVAKGTDGYVRVASTNKVWINYLKDGVPTWGEFSEEAASFLERFFYWNRVTPRSLGTTIAAKSGNTLTLADAAAVSTTNADVLYNGSPAWDALLAGNAFPGGFSYSVRENVKVRIQPGRYAVTGIRNFPNVNGWEIFGEHRADTIMYTPKGRGFFMNYVAGSYNYGHDLTFVQWNGRKYWGFEDPVNFEAPHLFAPFLFTGNPNNGKSGETGNRAERIDVYNSFNGINFTASNNSTAKFCRAWQTNGNTQKYFGWFFGIAYCKNTFIEDCEYYADRIGNAFEIFQADGGGFRNCISRNGFVASNFSGGNYHMDSFDIEVDLDKYPDIPWNNGITMVMNINTNIGGGADNPAVLGAGGTITNPRIVINQGTDGKLLNGIVINQDCVNVRIYGTHPAKPGAGFLQYNRSAASPTYGEVAGVNSVEKTVIEGIRVKGLDDTVAVYGSIVSHENGAQLVKNCVADRILVLDEPTSTFNNVVGSRGNISNATYEAL